MLLFREAGAPTNAQSTKWKHEHPNPPHEWKCGSLSFLTALQMPEWKCGSCLALGREWRNGSVAPTNHEYVQASAGK